jgi:hypothetical protein
MDARLPAGASFEVDRREAEDGVAVILPVERPLTLSSIHLDHPVNLADVIPAQAGIHFDFRAISHSARNHVICEDQDGFQLTLE